mgnify:CR=1 FL=1
MHFHFFVVVVFSCENAVNVENIENAVKNAENTENAVKNMSKDGIDLKPYANKPFLMVFKIKKLSV